MIPRRALRSFQDGTAGQEGNDGGEADKNNNVDEAAEKEKEVRGKSSAAASWCPFQADGEAADGENDESEEEVVAMKEKNGDGRISPSAGRDAANDAESSVPPSSRTENEKEKEAEEYKTGWRRSDSEGF